MNALLLISPAEGDIFDPPTELLKNMIFNQGQKYFAAGWGGVALHPAQRHPEGIVIGMPSLEFWFMESGGFFFRFLAEDGKALVPYHAAALGETTPWYYGGEPMHIPARCLVTRETAWSIVETFRQSHTRSSQVDWVSWDSITLG